MIQVPDVATGLSASKTSFKGSFTRKSYFALSLKVKERRKRIIVITERRSLIAKSASEIGRVNEP
jgi:hypothetical protein